MCNKYGLLILEIGRPYLFLVVSVVFAKRTNQRKNTLIYPLFS